MFCHSLLITIPLMKGTVSRFMTPPPVWRRSFVAPLCQHLDDDPRADGESFHERLPLGQIVHLGRAVCEFFEDFLFFVVQPGEQVFLMPHHQRQQFCVCAVFLERPLPRRDVAEPQVFKDVHVPPPLPFPTCR